MNTSYLLDKLAILAISPLGSALLLGVLALLAASLRRRAVAGFLGLVALLWLGAWSAPRIANDFRASMEAAYPPIMIGEMPRAGAIVLLGGGMRPPTKTVGVPVLVDGGDRVWAAGRLYRSGRAPLVIASGGTDARVYTASEASAMRQMLIDLGVPESAVMLEERSRNTRENAIFSAELLRQRGVQRILLVTSALHMARAKVEFESLGLEVIPAPADHQARDVSALPWWQQWLPDVDALKISQLAIKEWVALRVR